MSIDRLMVRLRKGEKKSKKKLAGKYESLSQILYWIM